MAAGRIPYMLVAEVARYLYKTKLVFKQKYTGFGNVVDKRYCKIFSEGYSYGIWEKNDKKYLKNVCFHSKNQYMVKAEVKIWHLITLNLRQDVVDYYEGLMKEATMREQHALWRVRRLQLDAKRLEFFKQQDETLGAELAKNPLPTDRVRNFTYTN